MRAKLSRFSLTLFATLAAVAVPAPADAVPVVGSFTAEVIQINGDEAAAAPEFTDQAPVVGSFGYDTALAADSNPDPDFGQYQFTSSAFVSITVNGATYATDPSLGAITVSLNRSLVEGTQQFSITGGLVPQAQLADAIGDFPLIIILGFGNSIAPFVPSDDLPTEDFSLSAFADPNGRLGSPDLSSTPYWVFFQLRTLDIAAVPEPPIVILLGLGLIGIGASRCRRSQGSPGAERPVGARPLPRV